MKRLVCLTFHTERLHDDKVWESVKGILEFLISEDISATWFSIAPVHPVYISFSPEKWSRRLKEISSKKQQIEQHTHFYKEIKGPYDLSFANLKKRLQEDKSWLESHGFNIKGFVGGGWAINKDLLKLLIVNNYLYDCTITAFRTEYSDVVPGLCPAKFTLGSKSLMEIPTSCRPSLKKAFSAISHLGKNQIFQLDKLEFCVIYLHDFDLIQWKTRNDLKFVLKLFRLNAKFITTHQLSLYLNSSHLINVDLEE